jgi:hypothetical protein
MLSRTVFTTPGYAIIAYPLVAQFVVGRHRDDERIQADVLEFLKCRDRVLLQFSVQSDFLVLLWHSVVKHAVGSIE